MEGTKETALFFSFCGGKFLLTRPAPGVWRLRDAGGDNLKNAGAVQTLAKDLGEMPPDGELPFGVIKTPEGFTARAEDGVGAGLDGGGLFFTAADGEVRRRIEGVRVFSDRTEVFLPIRPEERFFGGGERFDAVDRRGKKTAVYAVDRWCRTRGNSYAPIPFVLSTNLSAVFLNRYERSLLDVGKTDKARMRLTQFDAPLDLYVFLADAPEKLLSAFCRLAGLPALPPIWAFGTLVCRYHPEFENKAGVFAMARAMEDNGFPWDAVILEGFRPYPKANRAELREISETLHKKGKRVMLYEPCGRFPEDAAKDYGLEDRFAVQSDEGVYLREALSYNRADHRGKKRMRFIDLTNPESREKWYGFWDDLIKGCGIDGAKIDFCEQFPEAPGLRFADGRSPAGAHHWYPTLYNALQHRHFNEREDGGLNFSRGGGIGAGRYPFIWAGDQRREFAFLQPVLNAALSLGLSGVPFVSWDMAGYYPALKPYDRLRENRVFLRGLQLSAFSSNIQTHGRVRRPYDFDEKTKALYRAYARLHDCLKDYLFAQAKTACETGLPMLRHLFFYAPEDPAAVNTHDEYLLGEALLVAPVLTRKNRRDVYLPRGRWTEIFTGEVFEGPTLLEDLAVPPERIPVFRLGDAGGETLSACLSAAKPYIDGIAAAWTRKK